LVSNYDLIIDIIETDSLSGQKINQTSQEHEGRNQYLAKHVEG